MIKEWICADCVKFKTDACPTCACGYVPNVSCRDVLVDFDYAYEKGRADAIDEFAKLIHKNINELNHHQVDFLAGQLKEQKNDR